MRFLVTNDDGIDAPGLEALRRLAEELGPPVVVAPADHHSGCGHQTTTHGPIRVEEEGPHRFRVHGTPVDCVRLGLTELAPDADAVLSGINPGGNLGVDLYMSGTVAAAREAALLGRRAAALSQYLNGAPPDWDLAVARLRPVLRRLVADPAGPWLFWNVNLPDPGRATGNPGLVFCDPDALPLHVRYRRDAQGFLYAGDYHTRPRTPGRDVHVCFAGAITVSRIRPGP